MSFNPNDWPRYSAALIFAHIRDDAGGQEAPKKEAPKNPEEAGGRNNFFASRAGQLRRLGLEPDAILAAIRAENAAKGYALPERELATIAKSIGAYEVGEAADAGGLDENVRRGIENHGVRIDAVGRFRDIATGSISRHITPPLLTDLIWSDLRKLKKVSAEDIARILNVEIYHAKQREHAKIAARVLGKPENAEALEELRRFVVAVAGKADTAVMAGFLQFLWCVKRSLAGLTREHDIMPILYNQIQGNGKSTAVRRLVSPLEELVDSITVETLADERKRADLGRFVVGVWDEMEGADKRDTDAIKNALSSQMVSYRPMRTNDNVTIVRTMNFIGTSNKPLAAMVRDSSGNRRFVEVETLAKLDHTAINAINYPLLWQAISENAEAPAKAVLAEIRAHQAVGRFQDSVAMWLASEDFDAFEGGAVPVEEIRALYTVWCERAAENPLPVALFRTRLMAEGFREGRTRTAEGKRPRVFFLPNRNDGNKSNVIPAEVDRNGPSGPDLGPKSVHKSVHLKTSEDNRIDVMDQVDQQKSMFREKTDFPRTPNSPVHSVQRSTPWPTPPGGGELWVYDCEVFPNRFMFSAFNGSEWVEFNETNLNELAEWIKDKRKVLAGFNSHGYDDVIIGSLAYDGRNRNAAAIYRLSTRIIEPKNEAEKDANFRDRYKGRPWAYSVDVFQLLNAKGSLKEWECRIGFPTVAESPAAFDKPLPYEMVPEVRAYCRNDVLATAQILTSRWHLVELREKLAAAFRLGNRAYCLSEQGLAQATFLALHKQETGEASGRVREKAAEAPENANDRLPLADLISSRVVFGTLEFQRTLERLRTGYLVKGGEKAWAIELDGQPLAETFHLGGCELSLGVGGLHTVDGPGIITATDDAAIVDLDVTSYYPSLMISEGIYPSQLGEHFIQNMTELRERRVKAKREGDKTTADALKIVLNATFGKLNDNWSPIRSVSNAFRVTINGQLFLMMLIEALAEAGFKILSANTDGVTVQAARFYTDAHLVGVMSRWEQATGMQLERTEFAKVCRRDVNNYVALATDGKVKTKGVFNADAGKGDGAVIRKAAIAYLLHGTDPAHTIANETDPTAFLFYQRAKNGGDLWYGDVLIGKTARWYAATVGMAIKRKNPNGSFDTIPNGHCAALALDLTGWTVDSMQALNRAHYVEAAWDIIRETQGKESP